MGTPTPPAFTRLEGSRTALVVIDLQNHFMALLPAAREVVPRVNALARSVRRAGGNVVWVQNQKTLHDPRYEITAAIFGAEANLASAVSLQPGHSGFDIWPELELIERDCRIIKRTYSAFAPDSSNLQGLLQELDVDTVLIAGAATNVCCESTARDAMMRGYRVVMVADALATYAQEEHEVSLRTFRKFFGDVRSVSEVMGLLSDTQAQ